MGKIEVYVETGKTRTFAGAIDWPGWCRSARGEAAALQALLDYGPRYARAIRAARLDFEPPAKIAAFAVVERLPGNATTDYGAPDGASAGDGEPVADAELKRFQALLSACWRTFDAAAKAAAGHAQRLRKGPRGGGRELDEIVGHVMQAEVSYLGRAGVQLDAAADVAQTRQAILKALDLSAHGKIAAVGPRGGRRWSPRRFVRRAAWHVLDHAWEIEDRAP